ncbi:MAG TPA: hypothetical protein VF160_11865 [Candidatus Dormibacteraeota bacterium]
MPRLLKATLALIAIGLMAGTVVLGRAYRDAGRTGGPLIQIPTTVADLSARPLALPQPGLGDPCPATPFSDIDVHYGGASHLSNVLGGGPVYGTGSPTSFTAWGRYYRVLYFTSPTVSGPVLVRGRDLRTGRQVIFVGDFAEGAVVGSDVLAGSRVQQHDELVLNAGRGGVKVDPAGWWTWHATQGVPGEASGCYGFQLDGEDFSEIVVAQESSL